MGLGRNKNCQVICAYKGNEENCPKECSKCAITIKKYGDAALKEDDLDLAIKQYKSAVFLEPNYASAWCNLANAYRKKSEYNTALRSFNKAIAIDPIYGQALFGKALTLKNLGQLDEAMELTNKILELYDDDNVEEFKKKLIKAGVKDNAGVIKTETAIGALEYKVNKNDSLENSTWSPPSAPSLPSFSSKALSSYKKLEPLEVLETDDSGDTTDVTSQIVVETKDYYVYTYRRKPDHYKYLIRQTRNNPDEIVFLGDAYSDHCLFNGLIFGITGEFWGGNTLYSIDVVTGQTIDYRNWFSSKRLAIIDVLVGQDKIESLRIENDNLLVDVHRTKSNFRVNNEDDNDPFDLSMDYTLHVSVVRGQYFLLRLYTAIDANCLQTIGSSSLGRWHIATSKSKYYFIDNSKRAAKTRNGFILQTSYLDHAKRIVDDLERYGDNAPQMTSLSLQINMQDHVLQFTHEDVEAIILSFFRSIDDWTYRINTSDTGWNKLIGNKIERESIIEAWLSKTTHMQMNAIIMFGQKYASLNLPFIIAVMIENTTFSNRESRFNTFSDFIRSQFGLLIDKNDLKVFSSYYGIHYNNFGPTTNEYIRDIDIEALF